VVYIAPPTIPAPDVVFPTRMQLMSVGLPPTFQIPAPPLIPLTTLPEIMHPTSRGLADDSSAMPPPPVPVASLPSTRQFSRVGETPVIRMPPPSGALPFVIVIDSSRAALASPWKTKPRPAPWQSTTQRSGSPDAERITMLFATTTSRLPGPVQIPFAISTTSPPAARSIAA
jgi:hypothetical protein